MARAADSLHDSGASFARMMENSDNKNIETVGPLLDSLAWTLTASASGEAPQGCLILTGDLTLNGERESQLALAKKLSILPGNSTSTTPAPEAIWGTRSNSPPRWIPMSSLGFTQAAGTAARLAATAKA